MFWKVELFHRALEKESIESRMVDTKVQAHPTDDIKNPLFEGDLNLRDVEMLLQCDWCSISELVNEQF